MGSNTARKPAGTQHHEGEAVGAAMGDAIPTNEGREGNGRDAPTAYFSDNYGTAVRMVF